MLWQYNVLPPPCSMPPVLNQQTAVVYIYSGNSTGSYDTDEDKTMGGGSSNDDFYETNDTFDDKDSDAGKAIAMEKSSFSGRKR